MSDLVDRVLAALKYPSHAEELDRAFRDSAFLFEKHRGLPPAGWSEDVLAARVNDEDVERLKAALVEFIERGGHGCWPLSKCMDRELIGVFVGVLRREVGGDPGELFQALIALNDLGEDVFAGRSAMSILEVEHNRALARAYLRRLDAETD